jgi:hypothetical protein
MVEIQQSDYISTFFANLDKSILYPTKDLRLLSFNDLNVCQKRESFEYLI